MLLVRLRAVRFVAVTAGIARLPGVRRWSASPEASGENPGDENDRYERIAVKL